MLLLSLLALPARADMAMPPGLCDRLPEGTSCGDGATCRLLMCGKDNNDDGIIEVEWDCRRCMTQEKFEDFQRTRQAAKQYEARRRLLDWAPWALASVCLATFVGYQIRREYFDSSDEQ